MVPPLANKAGGQTFFPRFMIFSLPFLSSWIFCFKLHALAFCYWKHQVLFLIIILWKRSKWGKRSDEMSNRHWCFSSIRILEIDIFPIPKSSGNIFLIVSCSSSALLQEHLGVQQISVVIILNVFPFIFEPFIPNTANFFITTSPCATFR